MKEDEEKKVVKRKAMVSKPLGFLLQIGGAFTLIYAAMQFGQDVFAGCFTGVIAIAMIYIGSRTKNREKEE